MDKLETAVFYSTPSLLCILLFYVALPDRVFLILSAVGARASPIIQRGASGLFLLAYTCLIVVLLLGLSRHCTPQLGLRSVAVGKDDVYCAGFEVGSALVLTVLLFVDRATNAFFLAPCTQQPFSWRCTRAAVIGTCYTTITRDAGACLVLLGLAILVRYVRLGSRDRLASRHRRMATRLGACYIGVCCIEGLIAHERPYTSSGEKAYAVGLAASSITIFSTA